LRAAVGGIETVDLCDAAALLAQPLQELLDAVADRGEDTDARDADGPEAPFRPLPLRGGVAYCQDDVHPAEAGGVAEEVADLRPPRLVRNAVDVAAGPRPLEVERRRDQPLLHRDNRLGQPDRRGSAEHVPGKRLRGTDQWRAA